MPRPLAQTGPLEWSGAVHESVLEGVGDIRGDSQSMVVALDARVACLHGRVGTVSTPSSPNHRPTTTDADAEDT